MIPSEILDQWQAGLADGSIVPYLGPGVLADVRSTADGRPIPATGEQLILAMNNGKPMAILVDLLEGESPEALLDAIRLARARLALSDLRFTSRRNGTNTLTADQIEVEVRASRQRRRVRS